MAWSGVPHPFPSVHYLDYGFLNVTKIPTIFVDTGFAWDSVLGAFIAGLIPAYIAWYTIKKNISAMKEDRVHQQDSFDKDRNAQLEIATKNIKAQVISANRQQWINNLRESTAEYISAVHSLRKSRTIARHCLALSKKDGSDFLIVHRDAINSMTDDSRVVENLKYKILLLVNPAEPEAIEINRILQEISANTGSFRERPNKKKLYELSKELVAITQVYLKKEWIRVKDIN
ncbi:hypothetical protein [Enterobacter roggenkampii]|uniref:hypothetical protein n=1 Tax=Enterobacter roggenkampii TaxID=1812935 RepID=UPI00107EBC75|nr:hypothetical protein [Enterobacter roggenkampii]QBX86420.1 hypothetical protein E4005_17755 [Enterobacter roggenkampii]UWI98740.1 hypothetical protein N0B38_08805 [Enterobacter roggenkampii]